ncbi:hypothetical protein ACIA8M_11800 [Streptomyces anulatus]|uniref:hypothetical protein n=1 Tax=Streptomyces anulatus TaxID=1892 RepID=UPI0022592CBF|nr:hypothetical protein [Streptomyces anulatus]MCX4502471.1 hypothetical protein [Streptomyces anulatus]
MNIAQDTTAAGPGAPAGWDFGDCAYGLEPLLLPDPLGEKDDIPEPRALTGLDVQRLCPGLLSGPVVAPGAAVPDGALDGNAQHYWFRWITGHQVAFLLWRLLGQRLRGAEESSGAERADALEAMTAYVNGYCAMLLYTSSCPRAVYEDLIRPSMFLQHPGFSGTWAPDFAAVRPLLRGRGGSRWAAEPDGERLRQAIAVHHAIHSGIAARLVPGGRSLLQAATRAEVRSSRMLGTLYDNYFLTLRRPQTQEETVAQLLRRLEAVATDVAANGLYPASEDEDLPAELCDKNVVAYGHDLLTTLSCLVKHATGLDAATLDVQLQSV